MATDITTALAERRSALEKLERVDARIANGRFVLALVATGALLALLGDDDGWLWVAGAAVVGYVALALRHGGVLQRVEDARSAVRYLERLVELARDAGPLDAAEHAAPVEIDDPTRGDLDLLGRGSVLELLSTARTLPGRTTTARWLIEGAGADTIRARQAAVRELAGRADFREALWVAGDRTGGRLDPSFLADWGSAEPAPAALTRLRSLAIALSVTTTALAVGWALALPGARYAFELLILPHVALYLWTRARAAPILEPLRRTATTLEGYRRMLVVAEREELASPCCAELRAALAAGTGAPASAEIRALRRIAEMVESVANPIVAIVVAPLGFLDLHAVIALERWRAAHGRDASRWIEAVAELEALAGLAAFAEARPGCTMPEIVDGPPRFEAEELAHPLIASDTRVGNDVRLDPELRLLLVSGSNMSGKSTLLRSVGVAARMALAGAPVQARHLRLSPVELRSSIRVADSLAASSSHFHQEVLRLKETLDLALAGKPLLYLFDELLHGTNSRERALGARALLERLVESGAVGIVTTHDLAVTGVAEELGEHAANVHFSDQVEEGRMVFDYRMRPGVVKSTNAIRLMRAVGIDLTFEDPTPDRPQGP